MRRKVDRRLSLSLWEQRRRPPPAAETGRSCWGSGQQDASGSEANAGSRNPGSVTEGDGEGKDADDQIYKRSDSIPPTKSLPIATRCPFRNGLALSGAYAPALPEGEPFGNGSQSNKFIKHKKQRG